MGFAAYLLALTGSSLALIAWVWLLALAFRQGWLWGLVVLIVPGGGLVYVIRHWQEASAPFMLSILAGGLLGIWSYLAYQASPEKARQDQVAREQQERFERLMGQPEHTLPMPSRPAAPRQPARPTPPPGGSSPGSPPRTPSGSSNTPDGAKVCSPGPAPGASGTPSGATASPPANPRQTPPPKPTEPVTVLIWKPAGWDQAALPADSPLAKACSIAVSRRIDGKPAYAGASLGPPAAGGDDKVYAAFAAECKQHFTACLAGGVGRQEVTQTVGGVEYDRCVAYTGRRMLTVLTTVKSGRCVSYWYLGPTSGWQRFVDAIGQADVATTRPQ